MGGRITPCLLTVALSSVLILIISRQLPCVCRVAPRGSSAACMVTAILEVSERNICAWLVRLSWRGVLRFSADKERRGGRVKQFGSLKSAWRPVSRYEGFPVDSGTSFDACRLHMARDVLFLSDVSSMFSTGDFPRSAKALSPKTPLLDEVLEKRLSWHPLAIYNPSLLLRETVSCRGFPWRGVCRLGSPPSPPKIANTWSSCSTLFTSELKTTATYCSQEVFPW